MSGMPTGYADLHALPEDQRIKVIAEHVRRTGQTGLVCVDDIPGKAERYIRKFREQYPDIVVLSEPTAGPMAGVRSFKVGPQ